MGGGHFEGYSQRNTATSDDIYDLFDGGAEDTANIRDTAGVTSLPSILALSPFRHDDALIVGFSA